MTPFSDERVLILAPTGRDAALASAALTDAGLSAHICRDWNALCRELVEGAGASVITKEALTPAAHEGLRETLKDQPPWSDPPLVILTNTGPVTKQGRRLLEAVETLGNATLLERPLRIATLISTVRVALQTRRRQYELRDHLQERARLEQALQTEYEKQHRIAETLQRSLLNTPMPDAFPGLEVETVYKAAWQEADIGGDFFDVFSLHGNKVALVVGDVSGKGLEAASRTAEVKYALRAFLREEPSPSKTLSRLNTFLLDGQILDDQPLSSFVCLALGVLDTAYGSLVVSCAGLEAPLIIPKAGSHYPVPGFATPLGVTDRAAYTEHVIPMAEDDIILFVTDGITEARHGKRFFGYEGLMKTVQRVKAAHSLKKLGLEIVEEAAKFAGGQLHDDVCLLAARYDNS